MPATITTVERQAPEQKGFCFVGVSQLRVGSTLQFPVYDDRDVLLLANGQVVTPKFLRQLQNRNIANIQVHESELARMQAGRPLGTATAAPDDRRGCFCQFKTRESAWLDDELRQNGSLELPQQAEAFAREVRRHEATAYNEYDREAFIEVHARSVDEMERCFQSLAAGQGLDVATFQQIADDALSQIRTDVDLFASLSINPFSNKYPARHSLHTSMLALAIGTHMGFDRETLEELAFGCLLHDAGMLKIDQRIYNSDRRIDPVKFLEVTKHPILVFDMLREMRHISQRSAYVAYQIHERCNGSGYPRRREGNQIHVLAKAAAVADVYVGLVSPRPHRPGMMPYHAIEHILHGTRQGQFDPTVVRALLSAVSLFPVGSYVQLSDGRVSRVLRANSGSYDRPVVEVCQPGGEHHAAPIVNLAVQDSLQVVRALPSPEPAALSPGYGDHWV